MGDGIKRFRLTNEERDMSYDLNSSSKKSQTDVNNNSRRQQRVPGQNFMDKRDMSRTLFPKVGEPMFDLKKLSNSAGSFEIYKKIISGGGMYMNASSKKSTTYHASRNKIGRKNYARRDVGRWKPSDDLLLIISVLQVNDLDIVSNAAKFSCRFTYAEVQTRWNALLYDKLVSRTARSAIRKMHPVQQEAVHKRAPFSLSEEDILCEIKSYENPSLEDFQQLLEKNSGNFYHARTAKCLQKHWRLLKKYELLCDQRSNTQMCAAGVIPPSFSDTEADIDFECLKDDSFNGHVDQELRLMDQHLKKKVRLLENELGNWMQLVHGPSDSMDFCPKFDSKTFAILRGQHLRYAMKTQFISFGRFTLNGEEVDVDLSIEGPAHKISRYQGGIELRNNGTFATCNFGKRPFYVDGRPVFPEKMKVIRNNSIFEVCGINFVFLINKQLVEDVCFKAIDTD